MAMRRPRLVEFGWMVLAVLITLAVVAAYSAVSDDKPRDRKPSDVLSQEEKNKLDEKSRLRKQRLKVLEEKLAEEKALKDAAAATKRSTEPEGSGLTITATMPPAIVSAPTPPVVPSNAQCVQQCCCPCPAKPVAKPKPKPRPKPAPKPVVVIPQAPAVVVVPTPVVIPTIVVSTTPGACPLPTRKFRIHMWNESVSPLISECRLASATKFDAPNAFSRSSCVGSIWRAEKAAGGSLVWHAPTSVLARISSTAVGGSVEQLGTINLHNGFGSVDLSYNQIKGKTLSVHFQTPRGWEIYSPVGDREIRAYAQEFEKKDCAYDLSGTMAQFGSIVPARSSRSNVRPRVEPSYPRPMADG